jgi:hypothetical protein
VSTIVQPELVEATWRRVGALGPSAALKLQQDSGKVQPEIVGFVIGFTNHLRPDAIGLALYVMLVVLEMFRADRGRRLSKVREAVITRHWEANRQWASEVRATGLSVESLGDTVAPTTEPHVFRYIVEALTEENQDDPVSLSDEEAWQLVAVLKTVAESLHDARRA